MNCFVVMRLCTDVVTIIILYLEPKQMINFFREFGLDFGMKFLYDARNWPLECAEINIVFGSFTGIGLTGITFYDVGINFVCPFVVPLNKLTYCGIYYWNKFGVISDLLKKLCRLIDIRVLDIGGCHMAHVKALRKCRNLENLTLRRADSLTTPRVHDLYLCHGLRVLKMANMVLYWRDLMELKMCKRLEHLEFFKMLYRMGANIGGCKLECGGVRVVKMQRCGIEDLGILGGCVSLEDVEIIECEELRDVSELGKCERLRSVKIRRCGKVGDVSELVKCGMLGNVRIR